MKTKLLFFKRYINNILLDNIIPLIYISLLLLITFILPNSGLGEKIQPLWNDQSVFLTSLQEALSGSSPAYVNQGLVGSGYIALGVITTKILGVQPAVALVALNRFSFISTVLVFFLISHVLLCKVLSKAVEIRDNSSANKVKAVASTIAFTYTLTLVLSSNFVSFSDIPWTHFPATLITLICILTTIYSVKEFNQQKPAQYIWFSFLGSALGLLTQIRFFEGAIFVISLLIWLFLLLIKNGLSRNTIKRITFNVLPSVALFFIITSYLSLFISNTKNFHMLYLTFAKNNPSLKEATRIYIDNFPVKFVQLFVDTNFFNTNQSYTVQPIIFGFNISSWRMPLLLQVPALIYILPAAIGILFFIVFIKKDLLGLLSVEFILPFLVGSGLILGYVSSAASGSPLLKYGFVRDFMAPTWCLALITGPWVFYRYIPLFPIYARKFILLFSPVLPIIIGIFYGQILIKSTSFFQFQDFHVQTVHLKHNCRALECSIHVKMHNSKNQVIEAPRERYMINGLCPSTGNETAVTLSSQNQPFTLPFCAESYPVYVFPVNMGYTGPLEPPASWLFKSAKTSIR
ncbi:MAG TPA: hypothetical protein V6D14_12285 [Coleofasciculaceae cyanobacterium]|jgi:hypothetical protein